jgi:ABC-2 type transport system ATP-binding protein
MDPARKPLRIKSRVGYLPDQIGFYDELTAQENLIYTARLNGLPRQVSSPRIADTLQRVGLSEVANHRVATFSRGMRQRLGVADVLIKQPLLIIMDEPTQGLDPEGAHEFLDMIRSLKGEGITILLSSHLLYQVQAVCDRVGLFHRGRMVVQGSVDELAKRILGVAYRVNLEVEGPEQVIRGVLNSLPGATDVRYMGTRRYEVEAEHDLRAEAAQALVQNGGRLLRLDAEAHSLDEIYARYFQEAEHGDRNHSAIQ